MALLLPPEHDGGKPVCPWASEKALALASVIDRRKIPGNHFAPISGRSQQKTILETMPPLQTVAVTLQRKIPNLGILSCSAAINLRVKRPVNSGKQAARSMKNLLNNCLIGTVLAIAAVGPWRVSGIVTAQEAADNRALPTDVSGQTVFLFSYFTGNGESGLHLAWSTDGLRWEALAGGRPLVRPEVGGRLMRDPCIAQGPDGQFHMVWTTQWNDLGFGLSHSADLIHWSPQEFVPIMAQVPGAGIAGLRNSSGIRPPSNG